MATADKPTTVAENVPKVYHAGQMTVVENAKCLKGSKTDTAILLDDVSPVEHTMGVKVHGKNLFDKSTLQKDSVTKNLTQINNGFTFQTSATHKTMGVYSHIFLSAGTYYCSGIISSSDSLKGGWSIYDYDKNVFVINNSYKGTINASFTITESKTYRLVFYAPHSSAVDTTITVTNVQLELGTKATDYEPYNSDIQNVHSKNLIPYPYRDTTKTVNGITFTDNGDGSITIKGTATTDAAFSLCKIDFGDKPINAISVNSATNGIYTASKRLYYNQNHKGTTINIISGSTVDEIIYPQIELGTTATAYAKYHEPYPLVVSRYGKNLVTAQQVYSGCRDYQVVTIDDKTAVRFIDSKESKWEGIHFAPNTQYTVSFDFKVTPYSATATSTRSMLFSFFYDDNTTKPLVSDRTEDWLHITGTSSANKTVVGLGIYSYNYVNYVYIDVNSFQLEEGTSETDYEPYIAPTEYTPNANGTVEGVESLYPSTTLLTNDPYGKVYIDCDYYKDIDKAFNELSSAIALSGGE